MIIIAIPGTALPCRDEVKHMATAAGHTRIAARGARQRHL